MSLGGAALILLTAVFRFLFREKVPKGVFLALWELALLRLLIPVSFALPGAALPAGEYVSLRIILGAGAGRNWWCVVFPPLCTEALAEPDLDAFAALEPGARQLIVRGESGYAIRFRVVEWWNALAERFG